jgi:hypothetical protein
MTSLIAAANPFGIVSGLDRLRGKSGWIIVLGVVYAIAGFKRHHGHRVELRAHRMVTRSLCRLPEGRLFGLDFGDWFVLLGGSALIGLVTLLV